MSDNIDLQALVGPHKLSAVGFKDESCKDGWSGRSTVSSMLFTLDGKTYQAIEDPDDGYRSSMRELVLTNEEPSDKFEPIDVICNYVSEGSYGYKDDMIECVDAKTGVVLLSFGTSSIDDYYPSFEANFYNDRIENSLKPKVDARKEIKVNDEWTIIADICPEDNNLLVTIQHNSKDSIHAKTLEIKMDKKDIWIMDWSLLDDGKTQKQAKLIPRAEK